VNVAHGFYMKLEFQAKPVGSYPAIAGYPQTRDFPDCISVAEQNTY